jgi:hypothetical protein
MDVTLALYIDPLIIKVDTIILIGFIEQSELYLDFANISKMGQLLLLQIKEGFNLLDLIITQRIIADKKDVLLLQS